ncbi:hypothetical protein HUA78_36745 [Myxococcus sp. CA033]|uniref:hypothetical protein n=1 Tax=Myxococcus sp. CA033 TaxID=2741516 RepID=UPI00157B8AA7|nr:hypothetical protein [Myxococcus sp. CA033]NTX39994.1 hypothetical protein [Myxococcus sp. CA033]
MGLIQFLLGYALGVSLLWLILFRSRVPWRLCLALASFAAVQLGVMLHLWAENHAIKSLANFIEFVWYGLLASIVWIAPRLTASLEAWPRRGAWWSAVTLFSTAAMIAVYLLTPPLPEVFEGTR